MAEQTTRLAAPIDRVWDEVHRPALMAYVSRLILRFVPCDPPALPERFSDGAYVVALRLGGVLPVGRQVIDISHPDPSAPGTRVLRDNGRSALIHRWDHRISLEADGEGIRYTDRVTVEAGWRTPIVAAFTRVFYRHRQNRWRRLVAAGFDYSAA